MRIHNRDRSVMLSDRARWTSWRARRLQTAGFHPELAERLAQDARIDIHQLLELVDRGCAPPLAARILAPLDEPLPETGPQASRSPDPRRQ